MKRDRTAQVTIRNLPNMTKRELRLVVGWLRTVTKTLDSLTAKEELWLVKRKQYAHLLRFSLMK